MLETQGWIATAACTEVRMPLPEELRMTYAVAESRNKFRIASENPRKLEVVRRLLAEHADEAALIIGMYVDQIKAIAEEVDMQVITGSTSQRRRDELFEEFKSGRLGVLAVSKVANFAVDLPDASVAIQVSGTYGSRQEEAEQLGHICDRRQDATRHTLTLWSVAIRWNRTLPSSGNCSSASRDTPTTSATRNNMRSSNIEMDGRRRPRGRSWCSPSSMWLSPALSVG